MRDPQAHTLQGFACACGARPAARQLQRQHHVFQRGERGHQMKRLEHEADALRTQARAPVFIQQGEVRAREPDLAGGRRIEPGQQREQRGFAGARGADDGDRLAGAIVERHLANNGQQTFRAANLLGEVFSFENTFENLRAPGRSAFAGGSSR